LLPGMDPENAATKRIELSMAVQALNLEFPEVEISVSMGSASFPADRGNFEELIALADRRMYFHKREFHRNSGHAVVAAAAEAGVAAAD
jgi:GGDEF domain-containing protein